MSQRLILTLQLDPASQLFYEELRRRYFPPERNLIPAHLSLFHQLPDEKFTYQVLHKSAAAYVSFGLAEPAPRSIGRGVAIFYRSEVLAELHRALSTAFQPCLIPQDRQRFQAHIVIQNKVAPEIARETLSRIHADSLIEPRAIGLTLWRYLGGPWEHLCHFPFAAREMS
jgi:hypothetical protein